MPKYIIADFVVEFSPKYDVMRGLCEPFLYDGVRKADFALNVSDEYLSRLLSRMEAGTSLARAEEFACACAFCRAIISKKAMLVHSSAIMYRGGAYLFSAASGVGKSTHTKLWKQAFGSDVTYINDDKPVVRMGENSCIACGTPFDGGSGIANNISAPLKAIIFIERSKENSIRRATVKEIISGLYFSTAHFVSRNTAQHMLDNFDRLIGLTDFYVMKCNEDISAAYTAHDLLTKDNL